MNTPDFENFSVADDRAKEIRSDIDRLKESGWMEDFRLLAAELGQEDASIGAAGTQMELVGNAKPKVYRGALGSASEGLLVLLHGTDVFVRFKERSLLEVIQLPKAGEFAILHLDATFWDTMPGIADNIQEDLKHARKAKSDRQAHFKAFRSS